MEEFGEFQASREHHHPQQKQDDIEVYQIRNILNGNDAENYHQDPADSRGQTHVYLSAAELSERDQSISKNKYGRGHKYSVQGYAYIINQYDVNQSFQNSNQKGLQLVIKII